MEMIFAQKAVIFSKTWLYCHFKNVWANFYWIARIWILHESNGQIIETGKVFRVSLNECLYICLIKLDWRTVGVKEKQKYI